MPYIQYDPIEHLDPLDSYRDGVADNLPIEHAASIGRFIGVSAILEQSWHASAKEMTGLPDPVARALVGSPQISQLISVVRQVASAVAWSQSLLSALDVIVARARYISKVRNIVAHWAPDYRPDWIRFSQALSAKKTDDSRLLIYPVRLVELNNCSQLAMMIISEQRALVAHAHHGGKESHYIDSMAMTEKFIVSHDLPEDPDKRNSRVTTSGA